MPQSRNKWLLLTTCCISLFMVGLDTTIVNLALPTIQREMDATPSALQWTIDAYTVVLASLLTLSGAMADRFGRRRVFRLGLLVFSLASLLCGLAQDTGSLIAFRILQAVGGAMLNPVAMSIIVNTFTDRKERARAIGIWGGVAGISLAFGPVVGGALVDAAGWRSIFWLNVPIGGTALVLTALFIAESKAAQPRRADLVGQILLVAVLATVTFGIIEGPVKGWSSPLIIACFAAGAATAAALLFHELRHSHPLLDPAVFRSAGFSGAITAALCGFAALTGFLFLNSLYLQNVRELSPLRSGLLTLPMAAMTLLFGPLAGRVIATRGPRVPMMLAGGGMGSCGVLLLWIEPDTPVALLMAAYLLFGIGFGMLDPAVTYLAVSGMPLSRAGVAAGLTSTARQIGAALGVAVLGSVSTARVVGPFAEGFSEASRLSWAIIAGCGFAIVVLGLFTAQRSAGRLASGPVDRAEKRPSKAP